MVRINIIEPARLADQHLIAEYDEILMLLGYVRRFPDKKNIPEAYCLGQGHIRFFKDKVRYLKNRHERIKKEMVLRGFRPTKTIDLKNYPQTLHNDWTPTDQDKKIITARLKEKLAKKPYWYRYYGKNKETKFFTKLLE